MRTTPDRIRQAISFEIIGLLLIVPLGGLLFDHGAADFGLLALFGSLLATGWNYLWNLGFDHALQALRGTTRKTVGLRVVHALGFEGGLLLAMMPVIARWLDIGLLDALVLDLAIAGFYLGYAFVFTWVYDRTFPVD